MVRLPTRDDLGGLPSARPTARNAVARINVPDPVDRSAEIKAVDYSAQGRAFGDLSRSIERAGGAVAALARLQSKNQEFETEQQYQLFMRDREEDLNKAKRSTEPGQAENLAEQVENSYHEKASEFYKKIPDALKPKYDLKLLKGQMDHATHARDFGVAEQRRASVNKINELKETVYLPKAGVTPTGDLDALTKDYEELLDKNPHLTAIEKDELLREHMREIGVAHLNGKDPDDVLKLKKQRAPSLIDKIIQVESAGKIGAKAKTSSAAGLGQFIKSTWLNLIKKYKPELAKGVSDREILSWRTSAKHVDLNREMVGVYVRENQQILERNNVEVNAGSTYLAHFLGPQLAVRILSAPPGVLSSKVLPEKVVRANRFLRKKTAGDIVEWANGKMGNVAPRAFLALRNEDWDRAERSARKRIATQTAEIKRATEDDVRSIRETGVGLSGFDPKSAKGRLSPKAYQKYITDRNDAVDEHRAVGGFESMTNVDIEERLLAIEPKPGEKDYDRKAKVYLKAAKIADKMFKERRMDPAEAVNETESVAEVRRKVVEKEATQADVARERLNAQEQIGVPSALQKVITKREAYEVMDKVTILDGKDMRDAMRRTVLDLEDQYGELGERAFKEAVGYAIKDEDTAAVASRIFKKMALQGAVSTQDVRTLEEIEDVRARESAIEGTAQKLSPEMQAVQDFIYKKRFDRAPEFAKPNTRQIKALRDNPDRAAAFDEKFGPGQAAKILGKNER